MATRQEMWDRLGPDVDLLVIGGGITGCGIARDAALRGLDVALVEMRDFAYGTSSRSSKLVHGGLRYLEQYEFSLVFEAVSERRILLDIAPHLVEPLGFLFPVYKGARQPLIMIQAGMWLYDGLSLFRSPKLHRKLNPAAVKEEEPALRQQDLQGAPLYYDCATDDARLTLENALDAARAGAVVATRATVQGFLKDDAGRVCGVEVACGHSGARKRVRARAIVNATGPWTDRTLGMARADGGGAVLRPTKGIHLVVNADRLPVKHAVVCNHPDDGRVLFAIPWGDQTYIGTTDTDYQGDPSEVCASADDIRYLLEAANDYFPGRDLTPDDVISTWAGLRPLMRPVTSEDDLSESSVSREHQIMVGQDGLITIAGGKLTTYRRMAAEAVETAIKLLRLSNQLPADLATVHTDQEPLPGAVGWPENDDPTRLIARVHGIGGDALSEASAARLVGTYGTRAMDVARMVRAEPALGVPLVPGRPEILAQVDWAVREEMASEVSDVLIRRTQVYYRDADQGLGCVGVVGHRMAELLGWDDARRHASEQAYRDDVARSRRWRQIDVPPEVVAPPVASEQPVA
ncbi:MAG: glycerol-3-phosphate dehydrogenase [Alphaproteobacteria bacterium]|nr:glycerol-3-phosphate dehydrogenase [Alphaproteobacteria bacterium]